MRTLGLPTEYSFVDGYITDFSVSKNLTMVKNVDLAKSLKVVSPTGKVTYTNAPTTWSYNIVTNRDEKDNSGMYLPNIVSFIYNSPGSYINPSDPFEMKFDRINPTSSGNWIAGNSTRISQPTQDTVLVRTLNELGGNNNVIARKYVKTVDGVKIYKDPVDYLGRTIIGEHIYNEGATPIAMKIPFDNRLVTVKLVTKTTVGSGSWSSSNPVWSGGTRVLTDTKSVYVPVADLPVLFRKTVEELENELATETFCTLLDRDTHITSTSTEVVVNGNKYSGITYYNGVNARTNPPSGMITSYNKPYPGHVQRWILKQWNQDGTLPPNTGAYGQVWMMQFSSSTNSEITVVKGATTVYDAATRTLTYNESMISELWYTFEELPAQGKNWGGETIVKL